MIAETLKYTRQHYYKQKQDLKKRVDKESQVKALVLTEWKLLPRLGGRKTPMVTDAYSRKIMSFSLADNMEASTVS